MPDSENGGVSRRNFMHGSAVAASSLALMSGSPDTTAARPRGAGVEADARPTIKFLLNGETRSAAVEPRTTLVELLRDTLGLTGTKIGCNQGQCGACTVLLDGRRINSCLTLALTVDGAEITTIEGLSKPTGHLHPMQAAFEEHDAFQCGYCTPGQILSAIQCIDEGHAGSASEIREYMSGNLCRCAAYPNIVAAIETVRDGKKS